MCSALNVLEEESKLLIKNLSIPNIPVPSVDKTNEPIAIIFSPSIFPNNKPMTSNVPSKRAGITNFNKAKADIVHRLK